MLIQILSWWLRQVQSLVPARWRGETGRPDAVIVRIDRLDEQPERSDGAVLVRTRGEERFAGALRLPGGLPVGLAAGAGTALRLPPGMVLRREVTLPQAAERNLRQVLAFEMDRLTPFTPDEIFWEVSGLRREAAGRVRMNLMFTLRAPVERLLAALAQAGLRPGFLEDDAGRIALSAGFAPRARRAAVLYGVCAVLALACLAIPVIRQQAALDDAQARIDALAPAAHEAAALRGRLSLAASGQAAIAAAQPQGDTLQVLAALTNALPDGTWLTDFTLKSGELTIDGESSDAAKLIAVLTGTPKFHDPQFVAPVTRAVDGQADLFSIRLTVGP